MHKLFNSKFFEFFSLFCVVDMKNTFDRERMSFVIDKNKVVLTERARECVSDNKNVDSDWK